MLTMQYIKAAQVVLTMWRHSAFIAWIDIVSYMSLKKAEVSIFFFVQNTGLFREIFAENNAS